MNITRSLVAWEALEQVEHMKELNKCLWEIVLLKGLCMEQGSRPGRQRQSQFEQCDIYWSEGNQRCAQCNHVELCSKPKLHKIRMSHVNITSWASGTHQVSGNGTSSCTPAVPCPHHDCLGLRYGEDEDFVF
ncbi:PREDICTED: probable polygalacturonase At3g15720 [Prunus dulcis]|uniref:PREDICTED: probable polygalacturonase At3g15720 n=1 Tax=Prunus dulcis TaxID=3755 RepID=A0A5E4F6X6_PRUDU|nr:PREDICTED: probable polygalacturonase At3g15720 [Prunus dulcis]